MRGRRGSGRNDPSIPSGVTIATIFGAFLAFFAAAAAGAGAGAGAGGGGGGGAATSTSGSFTFFARPLGGIVLSCLLRTLFRLF